MTSRGRYLLLGCALALYWLVASTAFRVNLGSPVRFMNDDFDRSVYFARGVWLPEHTAAYRDVFSEYPQVPTFLFGLLRLPMMRETRPGVAYYKYSMLFSGLMLAVLFSLVVLLERFLPPAKKNLVFLLLLPAPLYFSYNRFDVLPALLCSVVLIQVKDHRWFVAAMTLGIATLTKWYPALLFFTIIIYMFYQRVGIAQMIRFSATYGLSCILIVAPTYVQGGASAVLSPYQFHAGRPVDALSLPGLLQPALHAIPFLRLPGDLPKTIFLVLQCVFALGAVLVRLDSYQKLLGWATITLAAYMLFSPIYSPQWLLWILPLLVLLAETRFDVALLITYGVMTYLEFPITYDAYGMLSPQMHIMACVNIALLALIMMSLGMRTKLLPTAPRNPEAAAVPG